MGRLPHKQLWPGRSGAGCALAALLAGPRETCSTRSYEAWSAACLSSWRPPIKRGWWTSAPTCRRERARGGRGAGVDSRRPRRNSCRQRPCHAACFSTCALLQPSMCLGDTRFDRPVTPPPPAGGCGHPLAGLPSGQAAAGRRTLRPLSWHASCRPGAEPPASLGPASSCQHCAAHGTAPCWQPACRLQRSVPLPHRGGEIGDRGARRQWCR